MQGESFRHSSDGGKLVSQLSQVRILNSHFLYPLILSFQVSLEDMQINFWSGIIVYKFIRGRTRQTRSTYGFQRERSQTCNSVMLPASLFRVHPPISHGSP